MLGVTRGEIGVYSGCSRGELGACKGCIRGVLHQPASRHLRTSGYSAKVRAQLARAADHGRTLVHFLPQCERFLWDMGAFIRGCFGGSHRGGARPGFRECLGRVEVVQGGGGQGLFLVCLGGI